MVTTFLMARAAIIIDEDICVTGIYICITDMQALDPLSKHSHHNPPLKPM